MAIERRSGQSEKEKEVSAQVKMTTWTRVRVEKRIQITTVPGQQLLHTLNNRYNDNSENNHCYLRIKLTYYDDSDDNVMKKKLFEILY